MRYSIADIHSSVGTFLQRSVSIIAETRVCCVTKNVSVGVNVRKGVLENPNEFTENRRCLNDAWEVTMRLSE